MSADLARSRGQTLRRLAEILVLIIAGEAIFSLPIHVARFFRPTFLLGLGLSNSDFGRISIAYGTVAMLCYLPGGFLADRFSARRLMGAALGLTGATGFYLTTLPDLRAFLWIYGFFAVTTILLFWAALIRATREWGGAAQQGLSFGVLDGGRGLFAAALASFAFIPYRMALGPDPLPSAALRHAALRSVYWVYTATTLLAAVLVLWLIPDRQAGPDSGPRFERRLLRQVLLRPAVWLQGLLVFCAYCAFKGIDNYSLFAVQVYGLTEVEGARVSVLAGWLRPLSALAAGLLADRLRPTRVAQLCFAALLAGYLAFALVAPDPRHGARLWAEIALTCVAAYGLRGSYLAIMEEIRVPRELTGTATGLICLVGFTPDAFIAALLGYLLDRAPGAVGHGRFFLCLALCALIGLATSALLAALRQRPRAR